VFVSIEWGYARYKVKSCVLNFDTDTREITDVSPFHRGNFIHETPDEIKTRIVKAMTSDDIDPADPASVEGEPNAEEKRKILEVGKNLDGG